MLRLHHATSSTASTIVRLVLAEKGLTYDSQLVDLARGEQHAPAFRAINPRGLVPALEHDGRVLVESTVIAQYLDDAFAAPSLVPAAAYGRALVRGWLRRVDEVIHPACATLTSALGTRRVLAQQPRDAIDARFARVTEPDLRERMHGAVVRGLDDPHVPAAFTMHERLVADMDAALASSAYLVDNAYSLADAAITPYLVRAEMLGLAALWAERPRGARWYEQVRARESFAQAFIFTDADRARLTVPPEDSARLFAR